MSPVIGARRKRPSPRARVVVPVESPERLTKENSRCCLSRRDSLGRMPIGWCSPECVRRPK